VFNPGKERQMKQHLKKHLKKHTQTWAALATLAALAGPAQAALVDRGGGMIYDTVRNITWLADMNYAFTSGYAAANAGGTGSHQIRANGRMGWDAAVAWADQLVFGGFSDWRLPTLNPADASCTDDFGFFYNCTGGELSGLFVADLGYNNNGSGLITSDDTAEQIANRALFRNVQSYDYASGTEYAPNPNSTWIFSSEVGVQYRDDKDVSRYAVAVRSGDVAAAVPEPQTLALALLALGAAAWVRRSGRRPCNRLHDRPGQG
jgi:MYXO-CTERM domain-containing protein